MHKSRISKKDENIAFFFGVLTFVMWGVFPIFFKQFGDNIGALEILSHRIIWSVVFLLIFIKIKGKMRNLRRILHLKKVVLMLMITGFFIASNWGIYIYAVNSGKILESGLGYLINPLFSMLLGAIFLKEKLSFSGKISVFLVFVAILIQFYALGKIPFISILLPASFAIYGLLKKKLAVPSMEGLFIETMLLFPFALFYVLFLTTFSQSHFNADKIGFLMICSGLVTIAPLITFNFAAQKLKLSTLGFLQYISPTSQILVAWLVYNEILDIYKIISFTLIWIGILIVSLDGLRRKNG